MHTFFQTLIPISFFNLIRIHFAEIEDNPLFPERKGNNLHFKVYLGTVCHTDADIQNTIFLQAETSAVFVYV